MRGWFNGFFHNKSIVFTWLVSYIIILLIPIAVSSVVYFQMQKTIEDSVIENNLMVISQIQKDIDELISDVEIISTQLMFSKYITDIAVATDETIDTLRFEATELVKELAVYNIAIRNVGGFYLYFSNSNTVVTPSGAADGALFYNANNLSDYLPYDEWKATLSQSLSGNYMKLTNTQNNTNSIFYFKKISSVQGVYYNIDATLVVMIDELMFLDKIKNVSYSGYEDVSFTVCNDTEVLISTHSIYGENELELLYKLNGKGFFNKKVNNKKIIVTYITSNLIDWKYILLIPENLFWQKTQYTRTILVVGLMISILLGVIISVILIKRNYNPVNKLITLFNTQTGVFTEKSQNEYYYIEEALSAILKEKDFALSELRGQKNIVKNSLLNKLLKGNYDNAASIENALKPFNVSFEADQFGVVLFEIDEYKKLFEEEVDLADEDRYKLCQFIIGNIFEELVAQKNIGYVFETDDNLMACIINFKNDNCDENIKEVRRLAKDANILLRRHFQINVSIIAGDIHGGLTGIPKAYGEALESKEYKTILGFGLTEKIKLYVENNYLKSNLSVTTIGDVFGLTAPYISKLFKEQEKISILDYINNLRIERAKKDILYTDKNIEQIAVDCGHTNVYTFLRVFKKQTGLTPGKFKERNSE